MSVVTSRRQISQFYDGFAKQLLCDFGLGNRRAESAIRMALEWIPKHSQRVLDIGCGLGWSSFEFVRHLPDAEVVGVDISPRLIELGTTLFNHHRLSLIVQDVRAGDWSAGQFAAIVMLDVYEHIPERDREAFHQAIDRTLSESGVVVLACPTPRHQEYLRLRKPHGLQPVDEDVSADDVRRLAFDIKGQVVDYRELCIWSQDAGDYFYAVISRGGIPASEKAARADRVRLWTAEQRRALLRERLGVRTLQGKLVVHEHGGPAIVVATQGLDAYSNTVVRGHIERLPFRVGLLHGPDLTQNEIGRALFSESLLPILWRRVLRGVRSTSEDLSRAKAIARHLKRNNVRLVLAEQGLCGAQLISACDLASIPLVVQFHGADAYETGILERHGAAYCDLFKRAAAIVVVSRDMQRQLMQLGAPREKMHYVCHGVDCEMFARADPMNSPPTFLSVGRFVDRKAPLLTLLAFAAVFRKNPQTRLWMVGDGILLDSSRHLAKALGVETAVEFLGVQTHEEVAALMQKCRAFVQHSIKPGSGDSEGTPVAIMEASASGLPVVATRHGGIPDVVVDHETGLLVAEGDVRGMAAAMLRMADHPQEAAIFGAAGRARIQDSFSFDQQITRLADVIRDAMKIAPGCRPSRQASPQVVL